MSTNIRQFFKQFPSDEACLEHLFNVRFGQGHECPKCNREANWYRIKAERAYSCQWCGNHLHPTVGTPFEDSRTSLQMWFYVIYLFTQTRHGVSGKEIQRQTGVTYKTAWRMGHQIRKHMAEVDGEEPLSGTVEADETFIGGVKAGGKGRNSGKAIVFGMLERDGDVITKVVPNAQRATLQPLIIQNVEVGSEMHTDEWIGYTNLNLMGYKHDTVHHRSKEYVRDNVHTNSIESFWRHLKSSIAGTHVSVSPKYLENYAKEFEYRFNARKNASSMLPELLSSFRKPKKS